MRVLQAVAAMGLALAALAGAPPRASAASSYDGCGGNYIDAVPIQITTPGTWCLRHNIVTNATYIQAVNVQTNNVTIDCNGFSLSNLSARVPTRSIGVLASGFSNITVRNCTIYGFFVGVSLTGTAPRTGLPAGGGHVIEANRLSQNRYIAIDVIGFASVIRGNIVANTGGFPRLGRAWGIRGLGGVDVIDNVVDGVDGTAGIGPGTGGAISGSTGIRIADFGNANPDITSSGSRIFGNRVRNVAQVAGIPTAAIELSGTGISVRDNLVAQTRRTQGYGVLCDGDARVRDNLIKNYSTPIGPGCTNDGGNVVN